MHFNDDRYDLERFIIMPNHVHLLVQMRRGFDLRKQCSSWLRFSARHVNEQLRLKGAFWQSEPFDHIVRSEEQFRYLQKYIEENPIKAKIKKGQSLFWKHVD